MERVGPDILRAYADALEDPRSMVNVELCRRLPELDQQMVLALNGATSERSGYKAAFPDAGIIVDGLRKRLLEVSASDKQGVILGMFYTTIDSFTRRPTVVVGIFPLYSGKVEYTLRPRDVDMRLWRSDGALFLRQESETGDDPLLVLNPNGPPHFLFYKESPFKPDHPYKSKLPGNDKKIWRLPEPSSYELCLEENIIKRALWVVNEGRRPKLFRQTGFTSFINSHCSVPEYIELHAAYTQLLLSGRLT